MDGNAHMRKRPIGDLVTCMKEALPAVECVFTVTESQSCRAQRRVLKLGSFVSRELVAQSVWVPATLDRFASTTTPKAKN